MTQANRAHVGPLLAAAREHAGMTQTQAAEALSVDSDTISNWERGKTEPKATQVIALALTYRTTPSDLLGVT
jgi:DNA-binding XRE family transcriptional regulator